MASDIGQGSWVTFGSILGTAATHYKVNNINWSGVSREVVDASHMLTTGGKEFVASENYDPGEVSLDIQFDPSISPIPAIQSAGTAQVVYMRFANGGTATAGWSAFGFASGFEAGVPKDDMMTGTVTIKLSGNVATAS